MPVRLPRYSKEEFARRGDELYDRLIRPLEDAQRGRFAAIDIETGAYEIADDELTACDRLEARVPEPQTWLVRVGQRYLHRFGGHSQQSAQ